MKAVREAAQLVVDWCRVGAFVCAAGSLGAMALCAAGVSAVAARASARRGAPSASPPSSKAQREIRKAVRRSFAATGIGGTDLRGWREAMQNAARDVRTLRAGLAAEQQRHAWNCIRLGRGGANGRIRRAEVALREARARARIAELRYAIACAHAGAVA